MSDNTKYIDKMELRKRLGEIFYEVKHGTKFIITHGQKKTPAAVLMKLPGDTLTIEISPNGNINYK